MNATEYLCTLEILPINGVKTASELSSPPGQNGRHFADDVCKRIFLNENMLIPIKFSLKFIPIGPIN